MARKKWGKVFQTLFRKYSVAKRPDSEETVALRLLPLSVGLRIDTTVPAGSAGGLGVSLFIWVSPVETPRQEGSLRIVNFPN